jgi:hypothetical protein
MRLANDCIYVWSEYHKGLEVGCVFDIKSIPLIKVKLLATKTHKDTDNFRQVNTQNLQTKY